MSPPGRTSLLPSSLPWHQGAWRILLDQLRQNRIPHALLLTGPRGLGKEHFAFEVVNLLLCEQTNNRFHSGLLKEITNEIKPCGRCRGCHLFQAHNHPDFRLIQPAEDKKVIAIDQVRPLAEFLSLTSQYAGFRIALISPAEKMNINAANSLLKTLEEPPDHVLLILVTSQPGLLPATIRSRCQTIQFTVPSKSIALSWMSDAMKVTKEAEILLAMAKGAPLLACEYERKNLIHQRQTIFNILEAVVTEGMDPVKAATDILKLESEDSLSWLFSWGVDLLRLKFNQTTPYLSSPDVLDSYKVILPFIEKRKILNFIDKIKEAIRFQNGTINQQCLMEDAMICLLAEPTETAV